MDLSTTHISGQRAMSPLPCAGSWILQITFTLENPSGQASSDPLVVETTEELLAATGRGDGHMIHHIRHLPSIF